MKTTILYGLLLFSMVASLCGCTADELPDSSEASGDVESFSITVADAGGYASVSGGTPTRATENDYTTTFVEGDQIGVFAVKNNALMPGVNNLRLTATKDGESLVWLDNAGKSPLRYTGATYYAYYPYRDGIEGTPNNTDKDATSFFANVIKGWTPATNQGSYTAYSAQDLMIAASQPTDKQLSFSMRHCMALVVLDLPKTKYTFTNVPTIPSYIIDAPPGTRFNSFIPYRMSDGTYRYLVKPTAAKISLSGSYTNAGNKVAEWTIDAKIAAGTYKVFTVDKDIEVSHNLQIGDFYMKDGSLVGKDKVLSAEEQADCIGIVFWVGGEALQQDPLLRDKYSDCSHGLVVALRDAALNGSDDMYWSNRYEFVQNWVNGNDTYKDVVNIQEINKMCGYSNTLALMAYNTEKGASSELYVLPCEAIQQYSAANPTPTNSSGWYFPSVMELKYVCWGQGQGQGITGRDNLNSYINTVGGSPFGSVTNCTYWSSTEGSYNNYDAWYVYFGKGNVGYSLKYNAAFRVRPLLAF